MYNHYLMIFCSNFCKKKLHYFKSFVCKSALLWQFLDKDRTYRTCSANLHSVSVTCFIADTGIYQYIIIISVVAVVMLTLVIVFILVCVKCPQYCVVDVMTYRQERNRLRKRIAQNRGKSVDLMHYLQLRKLQLSRQQRNMNTMALYFAVSEEMKATR